MEPQESSNDGFLGPFVLESGTITADIVKQIRRATGCKVSVRGRPNRTLTVRGPKKQLQEAYELACLVLCGGDLSQQAERPSAVHAAGHGGGETGPVAEPADNGAERASDVHAAGDGSSEIGTLAEPADITPKFMDVDAVDADHPPAGEPARVEIAGEANALFGSQPGEPAYLAALDSSGRLPDSLLNQCARAATSRRRLQMALDGDPLFPISAEFDPSWPWFGYWDNWTITRLPEGTLRFSDDMVDDAEATAWRAWAYRAGHSHDAWFAHAAPHGEPMHG